MTVSWSEFCALLSGISPDTALGRVVAIRAEEDENMIAQFSSEQRRIYDAWKLRQANELAGAAFEEEMAALERMFAAACGG